MFFIYKELYFHLTELASRKILEEIQLKKQQILKQGVAPTLNSPTLSPSLSAMGPGINLVRMLSKCSAFYMRTTLLLNFHIGEGEIFSKSHTNNTRSMSFTRRMAAPTNQYYQPLCRHTITQKIQTQYLHMCYTSYLTTEKKNKRYLLNSIHCFDISSINSPMRLYCLCARGLSGRQNAGSDFPVL